MISLFVVSLQLAILKVSNRKIPDHYS